MFWAPFSRAMCYTKNLTRVSEDNESVIESIADALVHFFIIQISILSYFLLLITSWLFELFKESRV